jgi:hypothetical protein
MTATMTTSNGSIKSQARVVIHVPDIGGGSLQKTDAKAIPDDTVPSGSA